VLDPASSNVPVPHTQLMSAVEVRSATGRDHDGVVRCVDAAYTPYVDAIGVRPAPLFDDYRQLIDAGWVCVAEDGGGVVGVIVMWPEMDHWYIDNIAVDPVRHGEGIGSVLLESAEQAARLAGRSEIRLYTNEAMTSNLEFYARRGFTETHRAVNGAYRRVYFRRVLDPAAQR
jgi:GNAT superfamily N-acetyltransferase